MFEALVERYSDGLVGLAGGLALGALFGLVAQRSRFCMRSAVIEVGRGAGGVSLSIWLAAVGVAILGVQTLMLAGLVQPDTIRMINGSASLSGAAIGGILFGAGMVLTRGCVSRLMVLASSGNLRAVVTGALFVAVAYATMKGPLAEARAFFASIWQIEGKNTVNLAQALGLSHVGAALGGAALLALALIIAARSRVSAWRVLGGIAVGALVVAAYAFTAALNGASFDPQPVRGLSFIAPAVNSLSSLASVGFRPDFDFGLVPGVFAGALVAALVSKSFRIEWFASPRASLRYITGAFLMGFGGVLAAGCTMGNGVSGWAVYSTGALVALGAMWVGGFVADRLVDHRAAAPAATPEQTIQAQTAALGV